jgi:ABC-type glycerol-3-phosphate transport system permease component
MFYQEYIYIYALLLLVAYCVFFPLHYAIADTFRKYREKLTSQVPSTVEAKVNIRLIYPA